MSTTDYPQRYQDLQEMIGRLEASAPGPMARLSELRRVALEPGAFDQVLDKALAART